MALILPQSLSWIPSSHIAKLIVLHGRNWLYCHITASQDDELKAVLSFLWFCFQKAQSQEASVSILFLLQSLSKHQGTSFHAKGLSLRGIYKLQSTYCNFTQWCNNTPFITQE